MKYICLRDDDTNYYTKYEELEEAYDWIWGKLPITLATIPFVHGSEAAIMKFDVEPNKFLLLRNGEYNSLKPIGFNSNLVSKLKLLILQGKIEIAQHGVNHRYNERGAEMYGDAVSFYSLRDGREYLEKCFDTKIVTFIPPSNTIDNICAKNVQLAGMNLFTSGTITYHSIFDKIKDIVINPSPLLEKVSNKKRFSPIKSRGRIKFFSSYTFGKQSDEEEYYLKLKNSLDMYGFVALGSHYRLFKDKSYQKKYLRLIDRISQIDDVCFVTAAEFYSLMEEKL